MWEHFANTSYSYCTHSTMAALGQARSGPSPWRPVPVWIYFYRSSRQWLFAQTVLLCLRSSSHELHSNVTPLSCVLLSPFSSRLPSPQSCLSADKAQASCAGLHNLIYLRCRRQPCRSLASDGQCRADPHQRTRISNMRYQWSTSRSQNINHGIIQDLHHRLRRPQYRPRAELPRQQSHPATLGLALQAHRRRRARTKSYQEPHRARLVPGLRLRSPTLDHYALVMASLTSRPVLPCLRR